MNLKVRIGTRGSALALWQAERVSSLLKNKGMEAGITVIKTSGDKIISASLHELGGKGLFVKEIQEALLEKRVDIAVHSLKDYPVENPSGLFLSCIPEREDSRDVLVTGRRFGSKELPEKAKVGTGSLRRKYQLKLLKPAWEIAPLRGNVDTRLGKVDEGIYDGIVLAAAGLKRLGKEPVISRYFTVDEVIPSVGQGAIAIESRRDDEALNGILKTMENENARLEIETERKFLSDLHGSCATPIGIHARISGDKIKIYAFLSSFSGEKWIREEIEGKVKERTSLADAVLGKFINKGAREMIS